MKRTLHSVAVVGAAAFLWGCGSDMGESSEISQPSESVTSQEQGLEGFDGRDALLAALGSLTLDCLTTVGPNAYFVDEKSGTLKRNFQFCGGKNGESILKQIDSILGVANSKQGQADGLGKHYAETWRKFQEGFPKDVTVCPTWKKIKKFNPPTFENVKAIIGTKEIGKEGYEYAVSDAKLCQGKPDCVVKNAMTCAGGFGSQFLIAGNPKGAETGSVIVDPAWWLTHYEFATDADNPFKQKGYYHAMSYYGDPPGSLYGAVERNGEPCSRWGEVSHTHYHDRMLQLIDCTDGDGWYCMTYCMEAPWSTAESPATPAY